MVATSSVLAKQALSIVVAVYNIDAKMKNKGRRADYLPAGASTKNQETTRDEWLQIIAL